MSTVTLPNVRIMNDVRLQVKLMDSGVAVDWSEVAIKSLCMYSEKQKTYAGSCSYTVDSDDPTILHALYPAEEQFYLGKYRIIASIEYDGDRVTYDAEAFTMVALTEDIDDETIEVEEISVGIQVSSIDTSILTSIIAACQQATDNANTKAGLANTAANNANSKANLANNAATSANSAATAANNKLIELAGYQSQLNGVISDVDKLEKNVELDYNLDFVGLSTDETQVAGGYGDGKFIYTSGSISSTPNNVAVIFPLGNHKYLKYKAYLSASTYLAVLLKTSVSSATSNIVYRSPQLSSSGWQEGVIDLSLYPTAQYAVFSTRTSASSYINGSYCLVTSEGIGHVVSDMQEKDTTMEKNISILDSGSSTSNSIFSFNPKKEWKERLAQLHRVMDVTGTDYQPLLLGWFTDVHDCAETLPRYREFFDYFSTSVFSATGDSKAYFDDVLHTGDTVKDNLSEGTPNWNANALAKWLNLAGNHEYYKTSTHTEKSTTSEVRNLLITPNETAWTANGVVTVPGKNYWYKDYSDKCIRLIGIDTGDWSLSFDSEQQTWLAAKLAETITMVDPNHSERVGWSVIIASHIAPKGKSMRSNSWCSLSSNADTSANTTFGDDTSINSTLVPIVKNFIDNGGKFVCYFTGHTHSDYIGFSADDPRQLIILQAMSTLDKYRSVQDRRFENSISMDCINAVSVNDRTSSITVARIGFGEDKYGRKRESFTYNYATRKFVNLTGDLTNIASKVGELEETLNNLVVIDNENV